MAKTKTPARGQRAKTSSGKKPVKSKNQVAGAFSRTIQEKPRKLS